MMQALQNRIDGILNYLKPLQPLVNCHMVEYITENHWENLLPENVIKEVEDFGMEKALDAFWKIRECLTKKENDITNNDHTNVSHHLEFNNLANFITTAHSHCVESDGVVCLSVDQFQNKLQSLGATNLDSLRIKEFMSGKKSHEVEVLSSMVATLSAWSGTTHTVELGGGKGFLAAMLAMLYNIPVLNIDCSPVNAKGAQLRNTKIQKMWPGLVKKAEESKLGIKSEKVGRFKKHKRTKATISGMETIFGEESTRLDMGTLKIAIIEDKQKTDVKTTDSQDKKDTTTKGKENPLYKHLVEFITPHTDLENLIKNHFNVCPRDDEINLCITGLHTCGDLGSTTARLFQQCSSSSVLCAVPCCYHLLTESTDGNLDLEHENTISGFPMSDYMKGQNIGRNARMLASQSVERVFASRQLPSESLFYRALLQVIIKTKTDGSICPEGKMKKVGEKCKSFPEYVKVAITKLNLDNSIKNITEKELNELQNQYKHFQENLNIFYLLRNCLAPVIESLILLDRLMFLAEEGFSGTIGESFIVKMFDPIISPRCHSLVAFRKKH